MARVQIVIEDTTDGVSLSLLCRPAMSCPPSEAQELAINLLEQLQAVLSRLGMPEPPTH